MELHLSAGGGPTGSPANSPDHVLLTLSPVGRGDIPALHEALDGLLGGPWVHVIVDLTGVRALPPVAIAALVPFHARLRGRGCRLVLVDPAGVLAQATRQNPWLRDLPSYPAPAAARAALPALAARPPAVPPPATADRAVAHAGPARGCVLPRQLGYPGAWADVGRSSR
jgi:anti-anti-sigma regulatory factor